MNSFYQIKLVNINIYFFMLLKQGYLTAFYHVFQRFSFLTKSRIEVHKNKVDDKNVKTLIKKD